MVVIPKLKIAFQDIPKAGSSSLFLWLYELLFEKAYQPATTPRGHKIWIHGWFRSQQTDSIYNCDTQNIYETA